MSQFRLISAPVSPPLRSQTFLFTGIVSSHSKPANYDVMFYEFMFPIFHYICVMWGPQFTLNGLKYWQFFNNKEKFYKLFLVSHNYCCSFKTFFINKHSLFLYWYIFVFQIKRSTFKILRVLLHYYIMSNETINGYFLGKHFFYLSNTI